MRRFTTVAALLFLITTCASVSEAAELLSETFDTDTANNTETTNTYGFSIDGGSSATVSGGVLRFAITSAGVVTRTMLRLAPGGMFTPDPVTNEVRIRFQMGSDPGGGATGLGFVQGNNAFIFHPGTTGGAFRHDGTPNQDMGFTPAGGGVMHQWDIVINTADASYTITITDGENPENVFEYSKILTANLTEFGFYATGENVTAGLFDNLSIESVEEFVPLDHFLFYKTKRSKDGSKFFQLGPLELEDTFGTFEAIVKKPRGLGLPANKNSEGINDSATHLVDYGTSENKDGPEFAGASDIHVTNQCGEVYVALKKPKGLLVPANKSLSEPAVVPVPEEHSVNHYRCYTAKVSRRLQDGTPLPKFPRGIQATVEEQFQSPPLRYDLKKVSRLCVPTAKDAVVGTPPSVLSGPDKGETISLEPAAVGLPGDSLLCYRVKVAKKMIDQDGCGPAENPQSTLIDPKPEAPARVTGIQTADQLGALQMDSIRPSELCIPSAISLPR